MKKKTNYNFKSVLEQIIDNVYKMEDVVEAKTYITNFLEEKKIDDVTKKQMLQNISEIKSMFKLQYYMTNSLLRFEGMSVNRYDKK
jgi:hypothetical protein